MKLGGKRNLEQDVFHHIRAVRALECERLSLEQHVVEAPRLGRQHRRVSHLAGFRDQCKAHRARGRVTRSPALARSCVRRMSIRAQRLPIDPRQRYGVNDFVARQAEHLRNDRGRGDLNQNHVIEADFVKGVLERDAPLDLVRLDHRGQHVVDGQGGLPDAAALRDSQSAVARIPPRLSEGCPHSAASQVSLKSSQRIIAPISNAALTGSS